MQQIQYNIDARGGTLNLSGVGHAGANFFIDGRGATINIIAGNQYNIYGGGIPYAPLWYVPMYCIPAAYSMVYPVSQGVYLVEYYSTLVYRAPLAAIAPPLLYRTIVSYRYAYM